MGEWDSYKQGDQRPAAVFSQQPGPESPHQRSQELTGDLMVTEFLSSETDPRRVSYCPVREAETPGDRDRNSLQERDEI